MVMSNNREELHVDAATLLSSSMALPWFIINNNVTVPHG